MPKTQLEKLWLGTGLLAAFVMVLIGYFFFISPQTSKTDDVNGQVSSAKLQNSVLQSRITTLAQQSKNLSTYQAQVKQARLALPSTSGLPDFLRTLQSIGNSTLADVSSLTVGTPTDVTTLASGTPAPAAATPTAAPTTTAPAAGTPSSTVAGVSVYALPITAQVSGSVSQLDDFLTQLQAVQPRAVLISQITQSSGASGTSGAGGSASGATSLNLTMQAFVAPSSAAEQAQLSAAAGK